MEQTLGKRIVENRKRLGMTQDQLAEKLGLTAQAVSKWENDQSCPDITMLPKLAEIFGITTDELLGMAGPKKVHEAEVVENENDEGTLHIGVGPSENGKWEFHWDSGRTGAMIFAVTVLAVGMLTLAGRILFWSASFWDILWPCALMALGISGIVKEFSVFNLAVTVFGGYSLVNNLGFLNWGYDGNLVFPILVVLFGIHLLIEAMKKPKGQRWWFKRNGSTVCSNGQQGNPQVHTTTDGEEFECASSFGDYSQVVDLPKLSGGEINCSFGDLTVDLTGCETLGEDCHIEANCSFGQLTLVVPRKFRVEPEANSAFADFIVEGHPDPNTQQVIWLEANVSFGGIKVRYI